MIDSFDRLRAEIVVLVGPRTAIVIGPIEFCPSDNRRADGDCRDEPTDDVIMSMTIRQFYNEDVSTYLSCPFVVVVVVVCLSVCFLFCVFFF